MTNHPNRSRSTKVYALPYSAKVAVRQDYPAGNSEIYVCGEGGKAMISRQSKNMPWHLYIAGRKVHSSKRLITVLTGLDGAMI